MSDSPTVSRRDFVKTVTALLGSVIGATVGIPAIGYLISPALTTAKSDAWIPLGPAANYPEGVPTLFNFTRTKVNGWEKATNSYGVYVLRTGDQVKAFSNRCTHLSCRVTWKEDLKQFVCPCHDGRFDIDGNVRAGPPPKPLETFETKIEDDKLSIHFLES